MRRGQAEESAYYLAQERKRQEQEPDGGKLRKEKPIETKVLTGGIGQAVSRNLEKKWIELGGRPLAVEAKDTAKKEADFARYLARRSVGALTASAEREGQGGGADGGGYPPAAGAPAEGQP